MSSAALLSLLLLCSLLLRLLLLPALALLLPLCVNESRREKRSCSPIVPDHTHTHEVGADKGKREGERVLVHES